jgi:focal adhesion kinase 1
VSGSQTWKHISLSCRAGDDYAECKEEVSVAIKTCKPDASHEDRVKFLEEAAVMKKFDHPHIIKLFGVMSHDRQTYIVMELAPLGQLRRYLLTEGSLISKLLLLRYIHQLASAMVHLESKGYVHRDIAARWGIPSHYCTVELSA